MKLLFYAYIRWAWQNKLICINLTQLRNDLTSEREEFDSNQIISNLLYNIGYFTLVQLRYMEL